MRFAVPAIALFASLASALPQTAAVEPTSAAAAATPAATVVPSAVPTHSTLPVSGGANAFTYPLGDVPLTAGKPVEIKWQANYGDSVTITLRQGDNDNNLDALVDVAVNIDNSGSYTWTPPKELEGATNYALEIVSGNSNNFTPKFEIDSNGDGLATTKSAATPPATETPTTSSSATESASKTTSATKSTATSDEDEDEDNSSTASSSSSSSSSKTSSTKTSSADEDEPTNDALPDDSQSSEDSSATTVRSSFALLVGVVVAVAVFN